MRALLKLVVAVGLLGILGIAAITGRNFYYASTDVGGKGSDSPLLEHPERTAIAGLHNVAFNSRDGTLLAAWYVPSRNGAAVVVTTGTAANRSTMLPEVRTLAEAGFGIVALDWPGTGLSRGKIDWGDGAPAALEGAIDWVIQQRETAPNRIGALGFSAGGAVTLRVAVDDLRIRSVVLTGTSPATNESRYWFHFGDHPLKVLPAEWAARFYGWPVGSLRPIDLVGRLASRPVLIIGGSGDPNANPEMSEELFEAARNPKEVWIAPGATHGDYAEAAPVEYARRLSDFFQRTLLNN